MAFSPVFEGGNFFKRALFGGGGGGNFLPCTKSEGGKILRVPTKCI